MAAAGINCTASSSSTGAAFARKRAAPHNAWRRATGNHNLLAAALPARVSSSTSSSNSSSSSSSVLGHQRASITISSTRSTACRSAAASASAAAAPASLTEQQREEWGAAVDLVKGLGFEQADADKIVARAFGWGTQAYWRREKVEEPPDAARAAEALRVLTDDAGLAPAELPRAVKAFPEVIGIAPDALRANLAKLRADWKLEGQVLAKAVARQPAVLGYTIDCLGDCAGECNRCWARF